MGRCRHSLTAEGEALAQRCAGGEPRWTTTGPQQHAPRVRAIPTGSVDAGPPPWGAMVQTAVPAPLGDPRPRRHRRRQ